MAQLEQISRNNKKGYKSSDGTIVIEPQFDDCIWAFGLDSYPSRKYASVAIKGKCGMINESGETVIPLEYQEVIHLFDDLFAVRKGTFMPVEKRNTSGAYQGAKFFSYKGEVLDDLRTRIESHPE